MDDAVPNIADVTADEVKLYPAKTGKKAKDVYPADASAPDLYEAIFKQNRSFEMHYKGECFRWEGPTLVSPARFVDGLPKEIIDSQEMQNLSQYFVIKTKGA